MLHAAGPVINQLVQIPNWVTAQLYLIAGVLHLEVYHSTYLDEDDDWFEPVRRYLSQNVWSIVRDQVFTDPGLMFGRGRLVLYKIECEGE